MTQKEKKSDKWVSHPDFEIYKPTRQTTIGFLVSWALVLFLIAGTILLAQVGK